MSAEQKQYLETLKNQEAALKERLDAARAMGVSGNSELISDLKGFLTRSRPAGGNYIDYDPLVNERICDMAVVEALHSLGSDSEWQYLLSGIEQASNGLAQQIKESEFAASVILKIGSSDLVGQVLKLCADKRQQVVANAVKTLVALKLPERPTHQSTNEFVGFSMPHEIVPLKLAAYFDQIVKIADNELFLTNDAKSLLNADDYQITDGQPEEITVSEVLNIDLPIYNLAYYVQDKKTYICTFSEAGLRWQEWWRQNGNKLIYSKELSQFALK
jgi:hypothetical protein